MAVNQDCETMRSCGVMRINILEVGKLKKYMLFLVVWMNLMILGGCSGSGSAPADGTATLEESPEMTETIANKLEEVNTVENARAIDDFTVENEMGLSLDDLVAYKGDVTNNQADCALVFVALCRDGKVDTVRGELEVYRESMTGNLYFEFADKVEQAKNARIVTSGNYVIMVMAGVTGVRYEEIDRAVTEALKP